MEEYYIISESESDNLTKTQIRMLVRDEIEKQFKKINNLSEKDIKKIVSDMMVNQYKFFWEKRSFWSKNI
jgi:chemotaxis methyl-accepting protein methylase